MNEATAPMRLLPGGADGKYIHLMIGVLSVAMFILIGSLLDIQRSNAIGLSLFALFIGIAIEVAQNVYMGGKNTVKESVFDSLWTWVGGIIMAYVFYTLGYVDLYYMIN